MPPLLAQHLSSINNSSSLTNPASSKRITSLSFVKTTYFDDTGIRALQCLDLIYLKDNTYKQAFYQNLRNVLDIIPKVRRIFESLSLATFEVNLAESQDLHLESTSSYRQLIMINNWKFQFKNSIHNEFTS